MAEMYGKSPVQLRLYLPYCFPLSSFSHDPGSGLAGILRLAFVRVKLLLDGCRCVGQLTQTVWVCWELRIAVFANSQHRDVPNSFHDSEITFCHADSFPQVDSGC